MTARERTVSRDGMLLNQITDQATAEFNESNQIISYQINARDHVCTQNTYTIPDLSYAK